MTMPQYDSEKCVSCGACVKSLKEEALQKLYMQKTIGLLEITEDVCMW